jgi:NADPH:quinone reductase-like Zn-dependent oxidoreductase
MSLIPSILVRRNTIVGSDYSGQILASRSTSFSIGDHVYGLVAPGPFKIFRGLGSVADTIVVPDMTCAKRPEHVDPVEAAGITLVGLTAVTLYQQVEETVKKHDNARILVCGGSSSVGAMVIPILKHHGCTVTATCSAPKADVVRKRGADHVLDCECDRSRRINRCGLIDDHAQKTETVHTLARYPNTLANMVRFIASSIASTITMHGRVARLYW